MRLSRWMDVLRARVRSIFWQTNVESELDKELRFHLEQQTRENMARGIEETEARYAASRRLGGIAQIQEECRDMRRVRYLECTLQDLKYAARSLNQARGFSILIVLTIALGIGRQQRDL